MSSVFKSPKVRYIEPVEVIPDYVDDTETIRNLEKQRKKKMGALSQFISHDNSYGNKTTLGA